VLKYCPVCHKVNNFYGISSVWPASPEHKSEIMSKREDKMARRPCPYKHGDAVETCQEVCPYKHGVEACLELYPVRLRGAPILHELSYHNFGRGGGRGGPSVPYKSTICISR